MRSLHDLACAPAPAVRAVRCGLGGRDFERLKAEIERRACNVLARKVYFAHLATRIDCKLLNLNVFSWYSWVGSNHRPPVPQLGDCRYQNISIANSFETYMAVKIEYYRLYWVCY